MSSAENHNESIENVEKSDEISTEMTINSNGLSTIMDVYDDTEKFKNEVKNLKNENNELFSKVKKSHDQIKYLSEENDDFRSHVKKLQDQIRNLKGIEFRPTINFKINYRCGNLETAVRFSMKLIMRSFIVPNMRTYINKNFRLKYLILMEFHILSSKNRKSVHNT